MVVSLCVSPVIEWRSVLSMTAGIGSSHTPLRDPVRISGIDSGWGWMDYVLFAQLHSSFAELSLIKALNQSLQKSSSPGLQGRQFKQQFLISTLCIHII